MTRDIRLGWALPGLLISLLLLPFLALAISSDLSNIADAIRHPFFVDALLTSLQTSFISLCFVIITGTPFAWRLSQYSSRAHRFDIWIDLPIVMPPAVVGIALLITFGRNGLLGKLLYNLDIQISFTWIAVVLAQIVVSAPFFVKAAVNAFHRVDFNSILTARSLGASKNKALVKVGIPLALPGLITAATLSWARAIGEFGATLLFAGNLPGKTQTLPLAIYTALESDVDVAIAIALVLGLLSLSLLFLLRFVVVLLASKHFITPANLEAITK